MSTIDAGIILFYIIGVFTLAWWSRSSTSTGSEAEDQFLAGKSHH